MIGSVLSCVDWAGRGGGIGERSKGPLAYFMKPPPVQHSDERARQMAEEFIAAQGAPVPIREGAAPSSARGDNVGVQDVHRPSV